MITAEQVYDDYKSGKLRWDERRDNKNNYQIFERTSKEKEKDASTGEKINFG